MKTISIELIKNKTFDLLANKISREDIADWASDLCQAEDTRTLTYEPKSDEVKIWRSLDFLVGIDLKASPDTYLHNQEDIEKFLSEL